MNNGLLIRIKKNTYELEGIFYWPGKKLNYESNQILLSTWTFVVVAVDTNVGLNIYINGTKDNFKSVTEAVDITISIYVSSYGGGNKNSFCAQQCKFTPG